MDKQDFIFKGSDGKYHFNEYKALQHITQLEQSLAEAKRANRELVEALNRMVKYEEIRQNQLNRGISIYSYEVNCWDAMKQGQRVLARHTQQESNNG